MRRRTHAYKQLGAEEAARLKQLLRVFSEAFGEMDATVLFAFVNYPKLARYAMKRIADSVHYLAINELQVPSGSVV